MQNPNRTLLRQTDAYPEISIPGFALTAVSGQVSAKAMQKQCIRLNAEY